MSREHRVTAGRHRILVLSRGGVGTMMSSPGIRALNIARVLARALPGSRVTLAAPGATDLVPDAPFHVMTYTSRTLPRLVMGFDVVVAQSLPPTALPAFFGRRFVLDFFTNFLIEGLEYRREYEQPAARQAWIEAQRTYLNLQLSMADFVICANERQRDAWMGMMSCLGLITGEVYDRDPTLKALVDVAAYGIRPEAVGPPLAGQSAVAVSPSRSDPTPDSRLPTPVLKGVFPGIGAEDTVVLWNGGILWWYDPVTLIRAVARIVPRRPDVKLLFLGTRYPVSGFDPGGTIDEAIALSRGLGLLDRHVFFNEGWLPYDQSGRFMVEADIGVSTYYDNLETHFSYRTRLVDFLWAETPVICTRGDVIAELVERRGLGVAVPQRDVDAMEGALARLLDDQGFYRACKENLRAVREELRWERTLQPLIDFCRKDAAGGGRGAAIARGKWWRAPDLLSRTARYALARAVERVQGVRTARPLR